MSNTLPISVTIQEAIARMVNLDYIPTGFTLFEMLDAFREEAEVDLDNCISGHSPSISIDALRSRLAACQQRLQLAYELEADIKAAIKHPSATELVLSDENTKDTRLLLSSLSDWAADRYGIGLADWEKPREPTSEPVEPDPISPPSSQGQKTQELTGVSIKPSAILHPSARWEDVTIKLRKNNQIILLNQDKFVRKSTYPEVGLADGRNNQLNILAGILLGFSQNRKYPKGASPDAAEKTALSKLRRSLRKFSGITKDPFTEFNKIDGWKPRFKILDETSLAQDRAEEKDFNFPIRENTPSSGDFYEEDDENYK